MKTTFYGIVSKLREADTKSGLLDVHIIKPGWGSSGYYPESVLQKAVTDKVYHEGMHMGWDHPTEWEDMERPERSLHNLAGALTQDAWYDVKGWDGPGIYSTAKPFPVYAESIKAMGEHIGISHNVYGESEWGKAESEEGKIITEIYPDDFNTVDFVTLPGAGGHFRTVFAEALKQSEGSSSIDKDKNKESLKGGDIVTEKITLSEVKKDTAIMEALRAEIMKESDAEKLSESLKDAQTKNTELKESLDKTNKDLLVQKGRTYALAKVAESKLPIASQARVVESIAIGEIPMKDHDSGLNTVEFDKAIEAAIKAEQDYIDSLFKESAISGVHDLGKSSKTQESITEAQTDYFKTLVESGMDANQAKRLAEIKED